MATTVQSLPGIEGIADGGAKADWRTKEGLRLFGIRHLSAAGAWHLKRYLEQVQPELVLIEGPAALHSGEMRGLTAGWERMADPLELTINTLREAYMKRCIHETVQAGTAPDKIVAIVECPS